MHHLLVISFISSLLLTVITQLKGQLGYSAPAHSEGEVNYDEIHAGPDPEYASGPHVLDETFLHAYTTEGFLEQIRRREQEEKDEALARRLQDEEVCVVWTLSSSAAHP